MHQACFCFHHSCKIEKIRDIQRFHGFISVLIRPGLSVVIAAAKFFLRLSYFCAIS